MARNTAQYVTLSWSIRKAETIRTWVVCPDGYLALMMATITEKKGEWNVERNAEIVVSHVKRINLEDGITYIMSIGETIEMVGEHIPGTIRNSLTRFGKMKVGSDIYHIIDSEKSFTEILGRSIMFEFKDGQKHLVKVMGIGFMGIVTGYDSEGMNITFTMDKVHSYYVNNRGALPEWAKGQGGQV